MSDVVIRAVKLGKRYRIGTYVTPYKTIRESIAAMARAPFRRLSQAANDGQHPARGEEDFIWALKDLSFEVRRGEVVGIIGRNGAGKTTLLKILSRITDPTEGHAEVRGRIGSLLEVGTGFHPELTGRENIYLNGAMLGMKRAEIEGKFEEIVAFAELEKFLDTPVKRYSSGMYVRLAFAVAAHLEPEILVIDEVLAVGDIEFQKKCLRKMESTGLEGRTVLFVSHNMPAVTRLCSRAILLDEGRIEKVGPVADVVSAYTSSISQSGAVKSWYDSGTAPGTGQIKLLSVSVADEKGEPLPLVEIDRPVHVNMKYYVAEPNLKFRCAAVFRTQGTVAFSSVEPTETVREKAGTYHSTLTVPRNLLSEGEYVVSFSIFSSRGVKHRYVQVDNALTFQVFDQMTGNSARGDYSEQLIGVVRPLLQWQLSFGDA